MQTADFDIRRMTREEIDLAVDWAAAEGWNPGLHDADCFHAADSDGFFVGLLDGEPIASISAVRYGDTFGFVGFYIVKPEYRGRGYGLKTWKAGIEHLAGRNMGLDGVVDQQENYRKSGFKLAYRNIRYEARGGGGRPENPGIIPLSQVPFEALAAYDRTLFPDARKRFLACWIRQPQSSALGILAGGRLKGFGVMRACRNGYKIGPLFADTPEAAGSLFRSFIATAAPDAPVYLDVPEVNPAAVSLAERHGITAGVRDGQDVHRRGAGTAFGKDLWGDLV